MRYRAIETRKPTIECDLVFSVLCESRGADDRCQKQNSKVSQNLCLDHVSTLSYLRQGDALLDL